MRKALAPVAHDVKKDEFVQLAKAHKRQLAGMSVVATRSTVQLIWEKTGLPVTLLQSGPLVGDQQIGFLIASREVAPVIFLRDVLAAHPHEPDASALLTDSDVHGIPLETNPATAAKAVLRVVAEHPDARGRWRPEA